MLAGEELEQVLNIYNDVVPENRISLDELLSHIRLGTIAPAEILNDARSLLVGLLRYANKQRSAKFPAAPPAWARRYYGCQWEISERPWPLDRLDWVDGDGPLQRSVPVLGRPRLERGEYYIADDPVTETTLIATRRPKLVSFTGADIFNDFLALDLHYTLRDAQFPVTTYLSYDEMADWLHQRSQGEEVAAGRLLLYPSTQDRQKILAFLGQYGPRFLPYRRPNRSAEEQLDYLSEFNFQYQTLAHAAGYLAKKPAPPPALPEGRSGSTTTDPVDIALGSLNRGLDQIKPRLRRLTDGTIVTTFQPTHTLSLCYATLWEAMNSHQPPFRLCALPACQHPFIPQRKDQTCCTSAHANNLRQSRRRRAL